MSLEDSPTQLKEDPPDPLSPAAEENSAQSVGTVKPISIAYKFLLAWFVFIGLLFAIALITNIDWAKPFLQRQISQMIHREVKLGHLAWNFGLNGLAVETNRLIIKDEDGSDFLTAAHAEMGVAFVALLNKQLIIRHLSFKKPELWAVRKKMHAWNFDDLMEIGPDIRFVQAEHGIVHIVDKASGQEPRWQPLTLDDVDLQFVYPLKNKKSPVHLSFKLKRPTYATTCSFTSLGGGPYDWKANKYLFDAEADQLSLDDFMPFVRAVAEIEQRFELKQTAAQTGSAEMQAKKLAADKAQAMASISGLFHVKLKGEGAWDTGLTAKLNVLAKDFSLVAPAFGVVTAPKAASDAEVYIDRQKLSWKDLVFKVANLELHSHGVIRNWKKQKSDYSANVAGHIGDLRDLNGLVDRQVKTKKGEFDVDPGEFGGAAEISINASRVKDKSDFVTDVDARGITLKSFLSENATHLTPMMSLLGLGDDTQLTGKLKLIPNEKLEISEGSLPLAKGRVTTSGTITLKNSNSHLNFDARALPLSELRRSATGSKYISQDLQKVFTISNKNKYAIGGILNARGSVDTSPEQVKTEGTGNVTGFSIQASDKSIRMSNVQGAFKWTGKKLQLDHLTGSIANGSYTLEGNTGLEKTPYLDWRMKAKHLDLKELGALMRLLQIRVPLFSENHLYGTVQSLDLHIVGPRTGPQVSFTAVPENMFYQPPGLSRPLQAKTGLIVYRGDKLVLTDVGFLAKSGQINTTMTIEDLSRLAKLTDLKLKTEGIDLSDVNYYLSSSLMPGPLKKLYLGFLHENKIFEVRGRTAADIACKFNGDKVLLNGSVNLDNVSAKVLQKDMPVEHICGTIVTAGNDLILKDLKGTFKQTVFALTGNVTNYMEANPLWRTKLTASLTPDEVLEMLPPLRDQAKKWQIGLHSKDLLDLHADYNSDGLQTNITFGIKAEPGDRISVVTPLGTFYQPVMEDLLVDGEVISTKDSCELKNAHVNIGDSVLVISGKLGSLFNSAAKSDPANPLSGRLMNVSVTTVKPVPAARILSIFDPVFSKNQATGTVAGEFALAGNVPDLRPSGKIVLNDICLPKFNLSDLSGTVVMPQTEEGQPQNLLGTVELPRLKLGGTHAEKLQAKLLIETTGGRQEANLKITDGHFLIAGGDVEWTGIADLNHRMLALKGSFNKLRAAEISEQLFTRAGEITGLLKGTFEVATEGKNNREAIANLNGKAEFIVENGSLARFGHLQTELTRVNLLHQGLFGFNLNNLLQSVVPVRTGLFKEITGNMHIDKGILTVDYLKYNADDMCLWAGGKANLNLDTIDLQIAGRIPRVSESVLSGHIGSMSRNFTLQRFATLATFGRLERLPSLPLLGDIASDRPRTFQFKVAAPLDKPKLLSNSIEKSFHWLPVHANASAHPLPNLD